MTRASATSLFKKPSTSLLHLHFILLVFIILSRKASSVSAALLNGGNEEIIDTKNYSLQLYCTNEETPGKCKESHHFSILPCLLVSVFMSTRHFKDSQAELSQTKRLNNFCAIKNIPLRILDKEILRKCSERLILKS